MDEPQDLKLNGWALKVRQPDPSSGRQPVIFLIHGWTGDESSMWVFAPRLPRGAVLVAPRAPFLSNHPNLSGYSWVEQRAGEFSELAAFAPAVGAFGELVSNLSRQYPTADFKSFGMVGFSQGAAFSFAYAMHNPQLVSKLAALAGFLPQGGSKQLAGLAKVPILIAHGAKDETVPLAKAREARAALETAGASVQFCESDTGHKLGVICFNQLAEFYKSS